MLDSSLSTPSHNDADTRRRVPHYTNTLGRGGLGATTVVQPEPNSINYGVFSSDPTNIVYRRAHPGIGTREYPEVLSCCVTESLPTYSGPGLGYSLAGRNWARHPKPALKRGD